MAYKAIVARIKVHPHPNADRLQIGSCCGLQVIVGLDTQDGDLGVFFPTDGQLSEEFCAANDLIARYDENGKKIGGGFFDENRRVRAQSFRGVKSDGFWVPESYIINTVNMYSAVKYAGLGFTEGIQFDTYVDIPICNKYITPQTRAARSQIKSDRPKSKVDMPKHVDTENIRYHINDLLPGDLITVTRKLHGTSGRYGHVQTNTKIKVTWLQRIAAFILGDMEVARTGFMPYVEWQHVIGTRNTILTENNTGYYGNEQFRHNTVAGITLHKGEVLYFELVGYVNEHRPIMEQKVKKETLKEVWQRFGAYMTYRYGCKPGQCDLYVYRITQQVIDGRHIELSWPQIKQRCQELGLKHVPEEEDYAGLFFREWDNVEEFMQDMDFLVNGKSEQEAIPEPIDSSHIMEGIVIRVDNAQGTRFYKLKSWIFGVLEGYIKDDADYVDIEETS